jgi:hypothetical protein
LAREVQLRFLATCKKWAFNRIMPGESLGACRVLLKRTTLAISPRGSYAGIVDFVCFTAKLIIELVGPQHLEPRPQAWEYGARPL